MKTLISIDPGASGGIAAMTSDGTMLFASKMPETPRDVFDLLQSAVAGTPPALVKCYMEQVSGFAGEGQPGSAMFNFGRGVGQIEGMLIGMKVPHDFVTPQRWQKALALGTSGRVKGNYAGMAPDQAKAEKKRIGNINAGIKRDWKNKLKATAQRLYPHVKVTLSICDALLILHYAIRQENGAVIIPPLPETLSIQQPQPQLL